MFRILRMVDCDVWEPIDNRTFNVYEHARLEMNELKRKIHDPMRIVKIEIGE